MQRLSWELPYPSRRQPVLASEVVATSQPLAAQAGMAMLERGGNAVDAAIAAAMALTVVEPTSNGIGADAFALLWHDGALHGLNASGRSAAGLDAGALLARDTMPLYGWDTVTVPGAVSAWAALSERFGSLPFDLLAQPAVRYARDGFLVSPVTAAAWAAGARVHGRSPAFAATFLPAGRAPRAGQLVRLPDHAVTLERIAATSGEDFYRGALAAAIATAARDAGSPLHEGDLAGHAPDWVEPLALDALGLRVHELPPNGQGIAALLALAVLGHTPVTDSAIGSADWLHWQAEAMKLAFSVVHLHVADPASMTVPATALLDPGRVADLAARIDPRRAGDPDHGQPAPGGTVYLCAADARGTMVSFIQSNYYGFGSGVVVPGTGIALHNRGAGFSCDAGHPNAVAPGQRPFHTIIPGFVTAGGAVAPRPLLAFGVMGGAMQPQGHVQVLLRLAAGESLQAALDAPRWRAESGRQLALEAGGFEPAVLEELERRGHRLTVDRGMGGFGGAQAALATEGGYVAASDPRKDGQAVGR